MEPTIVRVVCIELENIRCFEHIKVDIRARPWTVVLGDNGTGKSTLLRAIALALSSPKESSFLFEQGQATWIRKGSDSGRIVCDVLVNGRPAHSELVIRRRGYGETLESNADRAFQNVWERPPLVAGYGATRGGFGTRSRERYTVRDATATLFDQDAQLQNPELALRRSYKTSLLREQALRRLDEILLLPAGSTRLTDAGLTLTGNWSGAVPLSGMSDGYRSTLAWVIDMLGWNFQHVQTFGQRLQRGHVEGIVLVDEVEQHLHPLWQRRIIAQLHDQFSSVQFIVTTHAPLCVVGTTDLEDDEINLCVARANETRVELIGDVPLPRGQRADQILTSFLFGLDTSGDDETQGKIARLSKLLGIVNPTTEEHAQIETLRRELQSSLSFEETELASLVAQKIDEAQEEQLRGRIEAANLEARRQLARATDQFLAAPSRGKSQKKEVKKTKRSRSAKKNIRGTKS